MCSFSRHVEKLTRTVLQMCSQVFQCCWICSVKELKVCTNFSSLSSQFFFPLFPIFSPIFLSSLPSDTFNLLFLFLPNMNIEISGHNGQLSRTYFDKSPNLAFHVSDHEDGFHKFFICAKPWKIFSSGLLCLSMTQADLCLS